MTDKSLRYVGNPDFHDGFVRAVSHKDDEVLVTVEDCTGKRYTVCFDAVNSVESNSPQDMMLYALSEQDTDVESLRLYDFINWYFNESQKEGSKSYLRIVANRFTVTESK